MPSRVGWIPVSSATNTFRRAQSPSTGVIETQSAPCSERTALPAKVTESRSRIDAPTVSIGFTGSRRPSLSTAKAKAPSAATAVTKPSTT